jgi:hypothetical protein
MNLYGSEIPLIANTILMVYAKRVCKNERNAWLMKSRPACPHTNPDRAGHGSFEIGIGGGRPGQQQHRRMAAMITTLWGPTLVS